MGGRHHDSPELVSIRDVNNILNILSGCQTHLDGGRSEDGIIADATNAVKTVAWRKRVMV